MKKYQKYIEQKNNILAINGGLPVRKKPFPNRNLFNIEEKNILNKVIGNSIKTGIPIRYRGKYEEIYCKKFVKFMGGGNAHCVNSGTNALLCCLHALNLKKNSEIITPSVTDVGCVMPIILMGHTPVPTDIDKNSFNINLDQIKKKISKKTKAVIVAHIGGEVANIIEIKKFLKKKENFFNRGLLSIPWGKTKKH